MTFLTLHISVGALGVRVITLVLPADYEDLRGRIWPHVRASVPGETLSSPPREHNESEHEAKRECSVNNGDVAFV